MAWGTEYWEQPRRARPRNVTAHVRTKHALFRGNQVKDRELLCLPVEVQLEAIDQQGLKHQHKLIPGSRTFCLRHNIKSVSSNHFGPPVICGSLTPNADLTSCLR